MSSEVPRTRINFFKPQVADLSFEKIQKMIESTKAPAGEDEIRARVVSEIAGEMGLTDVNTIDALVAQVTLKSTIDPTENIDETGGGFMKGMFDALKIGVSSAMISTLIAIASLKLQGEAINVSTVAQQLVYAKDLLFQMEPRGLTAAIKVRMNDIVEVFQSLASWTGQTALELGVVQKIEIPPVVEETALEQAKKTFLLRFLSGGVQTLNAMLVAGATVNAGNETGEIGMSFWEDTTSASASQKKTFDKYFKLGLYTATTAQERETLASAINRFLNKTLKILTNEEAKELKDDIMGPDWF